MVVCHTLVEEPRCTVLLVVFYGRAKMCLGIYVKREDRPPYYIKFHVCVMCVGGRNTSQDKTRSHRSPHVHNNVKKCFNSPQVDGNCASCDALGQLKTLRCVHAQVPTCTGARKTKDKKKQAQRCNSGPTKETKARAQSCWRHG